MTLHPIRPTPMPRDTLDGTTAFSDEAGLPGPPRLLAWTAVQEAEATFDIHVLWDTRDLDAAMEAALAHARAFFGPQLRAGVVWATANSAVNGVQRSYDADGFAS
jgi:hypothetical protein